MPTIRFTKMHGAGNDYVYVNTLLYPITHPDQLSIRLSKRHFGVGSDGLILIGPPADKATADFSMRIFNADGSEATMCGNASRCVGKYLYERHFTDKTTIRLETLAGVRLLRLNLADSHVETVTVDMGTPTLADPTQFDSQKFASLGAHLTALDRTFTGQFVSMGNPHFVVHLADLSQTDIAKYGPLLETSEVFPDRCNIEFVQPLTDGSLRMRVWERGSGITLACGTGACATTVADILRSGGNRHRRVVMDGGELTIHWDSSSNIVHMTGGAEIVFDGEINI